MLISTYDDFRNLLDGIPNVPEHLKDPISLSIFVDPVTASDGFTYERNIFNKIINKHNLISPMTREPISDFCAPSNIIKSLVREFLLTIGIDYYLIKRSLQDKKPIQVDTKFIVTIPSSPSISLSIIKPIEIKQAIEIGNPINLVVVINISKSMDRQCYGNSLIHSRLEIVQYAIQMISCNLTERDRMGVVKFSTSSSVVSRLLPMNKLNIDIMRNDIRELKSDGCTDIFSGLSLAIDLFDENESIEIDDNCHIFLLTDGQDNGMLETISEQYLHLINGRSIPVLHTFGISNDINSSQLYSMSRINGLFYFISDSSMALTCFSNALANSRFWNNDIFDDRIDVLCDEICDIITDFDGDHYEICNILNDFVDMVHKKISKKRKINDKNNFFFMFCNGLISDCENTKNPNSGQIYKAFEYHNYINWGIHYLNQTILSFSTKCCTNFKDASSQVFITDGKQLVIDQCISFFNKEPLPYSKLYQYSHDELPETDTIGCYNISGGCFTGDSIICTLWGEIRVDYVDSLTIVMSNYGPTRIIKCIKIKYNDLIYKIGRMNLTAYHPIHYYGRDTVPIDISTKTYQYDGYVYDFILEDHGMLKCPDNLYVATFGHNIVNEVFYHEYFGSSRIVNDFMKLSNEFEITFESDPFKRDPETRRVCGLKTYQ